MFLVYVSVVLAFCTLTHRMFRAKFLAGSERSVSSSSAAGVDTTSTQACCSQIVQLACCDVYVRNSLHPVSQAPKGVDDGAAAAPVVSSHGVCGGVVSRQVHNSVPSLCDVRFNSIGFHVQVNSCLARLWVEWLGGFSDLPSTCLLCAGPRYDAARWTGCEMQSSRSRSVFFGFRSLLRRNPNDALDARPRSATVVQEEFGRQ